MSDDPIDDCECCASPHRLPPARYNPPGLPAVGYRIGRHGEFKAALLSRLSSTDYPALAGLRTREDDDFSIAMSDAHAVMLDVLSFYQERAINEAYLRTATERRSILELSRLIGYQLTPGVAASTWLAFGLEDAPGVPSLAARPVAIPAGTRVQSVPGPGEQPQTFETVEAVTARVEWNAIPAQLTEGQSFPSGTRELYLNGIDSQLQPGDVVLLVGSERETNVNSKRWAARPLTTVELDTERRTTRVTWAENLGANNPQWASANPVRAYALRARAALFGHNAPNPALLQVPANSNLVANGQWVGFDIQEKDLDLDTVYPKLVAGGWIVLAGGTGAEGDVSLPLEELLVKIEKVRHFSRNAFALSARITRATVDVSPDPARFELRDTLVLAQSEELKLAERIVAAPVFGHVLPLARRVPDLAPGQPLMLSGQRQRLRIVSEQPNVIFQRDDGAMVPLKPGDAFVVVAPPLWIDVGGEIAIPPAMVDYLLSSTTNSWMHWRLADRDGRTGDLYTVTAAVALQSAVKEDPLVTELCFIAESAGAISHDGDRTTLEFDSALGNVYDRASVTICGNLARATHGETVGEIGGSGDAAARNQRFVLKQAPLTYVSAGTTSGRASTLEMRIDGLLWHEVASLFNRRPNEHVYSLRHDDDGRTLVQTGDGVEGARLISGQDNVRFTYRRYLGSAGNVRAGQLTTLLGRPLGVREVTNPLKASGGQDAESRDDARRNAPSTVLTLGRAVSLQDYTDFSRTFAGVAKALAIWTGAGAGRGIFVTIAGPDGAPIESGSETHSNLTAALRRYGDSLLPLHVRSYKPVAFRLEAKLKIAADALGELVVANVESTLRQHFSFAARDFGQPVTIDEVMAVIHRAAGVEAVDVDELYRADPAAPAALNPRLFAHPAQLLDDGSLVPAELLTLDPGPLALEVLP